ncbi:MAG: Helix-turn-helix domain [Propionibacteriaceae bacterium]|nr:Helix-turn-helix domain [Propionibacteriaceae bacterium]
MTISLVPSATSQPTMQVDDVAKALGLSRGAAYNAIQTGEIPSIRIGRRIVVPTAAVRRMLQLDGGADAA